MVVWQKYMMTFCHAEQNSRAQHVQHDCHPIVQCFSMDLTTLSSVSANEEKVYRTAILWNICLKSISWQQLVPIHMIRNVNDLLIWGVICQYKKMIYLCRGILCILPKIIFMMSVLTYISKPICRSLKPIHDLRCER